MILRGNKLQNKKANTHKKRKKKNQSMFRRRCLLLMEGGWKDKMSLPNDNRGRFNLEEAANELQMDPTYVRALYTPIHYTFHKKSQRYPSESGRSSRPGQRSSTRKAMFPHYMPNSQLHTKVFGTPKGQFSNF